MARVFRLARVFLLALAVAMVFTLAANYFGWRLVAEAGGWGP